MTRSPKPPPWSAAELATLDSVYPRAGVAAALAALPRRHRQAIFCMASRRGLRSPVVAAAPRPNLQGEQLEQAIRLREQDAWSFARIGREFGICEASACNAVTIALGARQGFTPAQRDAKGRLTDEGRSRIRLALRKGLKGVDIQLRLGVSATCVAHQRRLYRADLKARGKAPLPPPGGGGAYSGVKIARAQKAAVEALFLQGLGAPKIMQRTGVSKTSCQRVRSVLIARLKRKGLCLPGCDSAGVRRVQAEGSRHIVPDQVAALRQLLLERMPVQPAALLTAIGASSAYRIRDALAAELAARGERLLPPLHTGRRRAVQPEPGWPPEGPGEIFRFRVLVRDQGFAAARAAWICEQHALAARQAAATRAQRQAERDRPQTFEERLEAIRSGRRALVPAFAPHRHLEPRYAEHYRPAEPPPPAQFGLFHEQPGDRT